MNLRVLKRWPGWALLVVVLVGLLTIGTTRDDGPRTAQDRIDSISKRLACPTCDGESVYESRAPSAQAIRDQIEKQVLAGTASDGEIIDSINRVQPTSLLLVPKSSGFEALIWVLPVTVLVLAIAALAVAFRRWHHTLDTEPTAEDRELVAAALRGERGPDADGDGR